MAVFNILPTSRQRAFRPRFKEQASPLPILDLEETHLSFNLRQVSFLQETNTSCSSCLDPPVAYVKSFLQKASSFCSSPHCLTCGCDVGTGELYTAKSAYLKPPATGSTGRAGPQHKRRLAVQQLRDFGGGPTAAKMLCTPLPVCSPGPHRQRAGSLSSARVSSPQRPGLSGVGEGVL